MIDQPDKTRGTSPLLRAKEIFLAVRSLSLPARDEEIDRLCGGDSRLRGMVEGLLAGEAAPLPFESLADDIIAARDAVGTLAGADPSVRADDSQLGSRIDRYRVLEKIGEGGFGVVYMAEQEEPVRRRVALKILKLGMDTRQIVARFEAERQALAMMDHPGIAKVHDAGATPTGRPFFVMELCSGRAITEFCDARHLSVRQRLALFAQVCQAVQHAHHKGLIHRDLKPSTNRPTSSSPVQSAAAQVLWQRCAACHGAMHTAAQFRADNRDTRLASGLDQWVVPGQPDDSRLLKFLNHVAGDAPAGRHDLSAGEWYALHARITSLPRCETPEVP